MPEEPERSTLKKSSEPEKAEKVAEPQAAAPESQAAAAEAAGQERQALPETMPEQEVRKHASKKKSQPVKVQKKEQEPVTPAENGAPSKLFSTLIRKLIFCTALGVFCYALSGLLILLLGYYTSQQEYKKLNDDMVVIGTTKEPEVSDNNQAVVEIPGWEPSEIQVPYLDISVDEEKLRALNSDYSFYIVIPGTNIQYPVVQGEDNDHYLRYTYSNQENTAGAVTVDCRTDRSTYLQTFNIIISAHNRQDGTMFSDLANYKDESFRDENPYVYIIMDGKEYVYEVYSFYAMEPVAICYNPYTADDVYLAFTQDNNSYTGGIEVTLEDRIITLYTCNEDSSMRYLCHAVLRDVYNLK
jgi:sortase B